MEPCGSCGGVCDEVLILHGLAGFVVGDGGGVVWA